MPYEPQYIVFGSISNLEVPVSIWITKSVPVNSEETSEPINTAQVSLFSQVGNAPPNLVTDNFIINNGVYTSSEAIEGIVGTSYWIEVTLDDGSTFVSKKEKLKAVVPITTTTIEDYNLINIRFSDPENSNNFYLMESEFVQNNERYHKTFAVSNDVLFNGNTNASLDLEVFSTPQIPTEALKVTLSNINFSSYQFHLNRVKQKQDNENNSGVDNEGTPGPLFATPPVNLFGNMTNSTNGKRILGNFTVDAIHQVEF
jgi:hypothetical protein